jgi:trk system potassium uptake protein TrkH
MATAAPPSRPERAAIASPLVPARLPRGWGLGAVLFVIGWLLVALGLAMLLPALIDHYAGNAEWADFLASAAGTVFIGALLILANRGNAHVLPFRAVFLLTTLSWVTVILFAALPLHLGPYDLGLTDAVFEATSGLTTTGSTVVAGLDKAPPGFLMWRAVLQGLGGIGIIVMAIVLLPFLRVGGMQLFRAESSDRSEKLVPSAAAMVRQIALVYAGLLVACTVALDSVGFTTFEALAHALTAVSTGGYSTRDASIGGFANPAAEWILVLFMLLGGMPFLRLVALVHGRWGLFLRDSQIRLYLLFCLLATTVLTVWLVSHEARPVPAALRAAAFNVVSIVTTTGYASEDYSLWGHSAVALFLALTIVGGCTGSTAGGIKIFRFEILWSAARFYIVGLFQPSRVATPHYGQKRIGTDIFFAVLSFVFFFIGSWGLITVLLGALGLDLVTAISGAATALANVGPGLGHIIGPAGNFQPLSEAVKWVLIFAMLLGRLEFFTILVLLHPAFWRR